MKTKSAVDISVNVCMEPYQHYIAIADVSGLWYRCTTIFWQNLSRIIAPDLSTICTHSQNLKINERLVYNSAIQPGAADFTCEWSDRIAQIFAICKN